MTISVNVYMGLDGSTWKTPRSSITWTDVSSSVSYGAGLSISRGRSTARDEVRAGTCSLTLVDTDRTWDPENASGPHYGFLNPGVPIKVTVSVAEVADDLFWGTDDLFWGADDLFWGAASVYDRFFGFVEDWPQGSYDPADKHVLVPLEAVDAFGMLALGRQRSVLANEILADSPLGYWPMTEQSGLVMGDLAGSADGEYVEGTPGLSAELDTGSGYKTRGIQFDNERCGFVGEVGVAPTERPAVIELVGCPDTGAAAGVLGVGDGNTERGMSLSLTSGSSGWYASGGIYDGDANNVVSTSANRLPNGTPAHIAFRRPTAGAAAIYHNGVDSGTPSTVAAAKIAFDPGVVVGAAKRSLVGAFAYEGFLGHVAVYDTDIGATRIAAHAAAAVAPLNGDATDERIDYLLDRAGYPTTDRALTTGYTTLGPADHDGEYTLDLIRRIEKTEQGRFFINQSGDATFHARYHGQLVAVGSSATFSDSGSDSPYSQVEVVRPRNMIHNKVTVTADGLAPLTVADATSIDAHGEREISIDAPLLPSASAQRSLGEYVLATSKDPQPRVMGMSVPIHKDPDTLIPVVLPLEQGDRITFERTPVGAGSAIAWDQTLEGYTERIDTHTWTWTPHLSPAEPVTFCTWGGAAVDAHEWGTGVWGY